MFRPLPVDGAPPCKIVLHAAAGTDPKELQQAYLRILGPINHFYAKAAQAVETGGLDQAAMQQTIPGASLRFTDNNGLRTVHVNLAVPRIRPTAPEAIKKVGRPQGYLAIDLVADANYFRSMVVNAQFGETNSDIARDSYTRGVLAGAVIDGNNPISALSWGLPYSGMPSAAPGLRQISDGSTSSLPQVEREFPPPPEADPTHPFELMLPGGDQTIEAATPLGFLVDLESLGAQGAMTIKLYVASISQRFVLNLSAGGDVEQLYRPSVGYRVRVRELDPNFPPKLVTVRYTGDYNELYTNPEAEFKFPESIVGGFYVEPSWVDTGSAEVSDPEQDGMGNLLDETSKVVRDVIGKVDPALDFSYPTLDGALWTEPVQGMTLVATIKWIPSELSGVPGTATIELA